MLLCGSEDDDVRLVVDAPADADADEIEIAKAVDSIITVSVVESSLVCFISSPETAAAELAA